MDWEAVGAIGETLGAIGVIAPLLSLTAQIRQNTRATLADARYSVGQTTSDMMLAISINGELAEIWLR